MNKKHLNSNLSILKKLNLTTLILLFFTCLSYHSIFAQSNACDEGWEDNALRIHYNGNAPFYHGVASGDPTQNSVIIWTRVTPTDVEKEFTPTHIPVDWYISKSADPATFADAANLVQQGSTQASANDDYTIKVTVTDLEQDTWYYYIFGAMDNWSVIGRTKTAPANPSQLRFGMVSCSNYAEGYFNAYELLKNKNSVDAVLHLGDYIYEYGDGEYGDRRDLAPPYEMTELRDYRFRYSLYHLDSKLQELHQQFPFITIWDDHEFTNDAWKGGAENHTEGTEGVWEERAGHALKAYDEWMPVTNVNPVYRKFNYGDLAEMYFLDTRYIGRDEPYGSLTPPDAQDDSRRLLGAEQYNWLASSITNSSAKWQILAQQIMFAPLDDPTNQLLPGDVIQGLSAINMDQWDGYIGERNRIHSLMESQLLDKNFVVLTGDIHTSWGNEIWGTDANLLTRCTDGLGVEFVVTSVTSPGLPAGTNAAVPVIQTLNPHMQYIEGEDHGFGILNVEENRTQMDWFYVDDITTETYVEKTSANKSMFVNDGETCLNTATSPAMHPAYPALIPTTRPETMTGLTPPASVSLADANCSGLAIELLAFGGKNIGKVNRLTWTTTKETNHSHFIIEKSLDKTNFEAIGQINSSTDVNEKNEYSFDDNQAVAGLNYYRLYQVDKDNKSHLSPIIAVETLTKPARYIIAPNPARQHTQVSFYTKNTEPIRIEILNHQGQILKTISERTIEGHNHFQIDLSDLASNIYTLSIIHEKSQITVSDVLIKM